MGGLNIATILERAAQNNPTKTLVVAGEQRMTFEEVEAGAARFANVLASLSVGIGARVMVVLPNSPMFLMCYFGTLKLGAIAVPLHSKATGPEIERVLHETAASVLVTTKSTHTVATHITENGTGLRHILIAGLDQDTALERSQQRLEVLLATADPHAETVETQDDDTAVILYTSGTTGYPKGVILTHRNCYFNARTIGIDVENLTGDDILLMFMPASFVVGQFMILLACILQTKLVIAARFEPDHVFELIEREQVSHFAAVAPAAQMLLNAPGADRYNLDSLRVILLGGSVVHPDLLARFKHRFNVDIVIGYGLTELATIAAAPADMIVPPGSVGKVAPHAQLRVVDEEGRDVPAGTVGEIIATGESLFRGYLAQPDTDTTSAFFDIWLRTGDVGHLDEAGYLYVMDRLTDAIKTAGHPVAPAEVERVLNNHPAIEEAAVVGIPHKQMGEIIHAFVVLRPDHAISSSRLIRYCKDNLSSYKSPRRVLFRSELPKNSNGKILRRVLREGL